MHDTLPLLLKTDFSPSCGGRIDPLPTVSRTAFPPLRRGRLDTLQVNLGYRCNQSCVHCHVAAGPTRKEIMDGDTINQVIAAAARLGVSTVDLTGGAPETNPHFRRLVQSLRGEGIRVIDRCNLTVLELKGQEDLAEFLAAQGVEVTASLPCYLEDNVDAQRGDGVFEASIRGIRRLNTLGYGREGSALVLNLVYNPQGPVLPPSQPALEAAYRQELRQRYDLVFNRLYTITNMPIKRFGSWLVSKGQFDAYLDLLREAHRDENLAQVMCLSLVSVDWQGFVYDCDFNQMLGLGLGAGRGRVHLSDLTPSGLADAPIRVAGHCYGCTAGAGSSCGGALGD